MLLATSRECGKSVDWLLTGEEESSRSARCQAYRRGSDKVRRKENRTLRAAGDDRLTGTRYDWFVEPGGGKAFAALRQSGLKTAQAWCKQRR